ncbi:MAG: ABC transporter substrate-binding protein, partial [Sulfolobus sp.]|nr:ABC transporter substrate-binding protein [Sulfolobus sp.]
MRSNFALSTTAAIIIAVIVIIAVIAGITVIITSHKPTPVTTTVYVTSTNTTTSTTIVTTSSLTTTTKSQVSATITPPNSSELIDVAWVAAPDALDPATGFYTQDGPLFSSAYQELIEFNGSSITSVVPVIAENWSTTNYQNWTFYIRQGVYFSDGVQVNASTVWFSFYRILIMGQGPAIANYLGLLVNTSTFLRTGYAIPWGVANALAQYLHVNASNATAVAYTLASILSHFNANNKTIQEIMSYPYQAVVVKGPYEVEISTMVPYRYFLYDIAVWWGAIQDPVYVDAHGGVQPNTPNSYINLHGMPGTGPYVI